MNSNSAMICDENGQDALLRFYTSPVLTPLLHLEETILGGDPHVSIENDGGLFGS